jgi:hypothetical protein
LLRALDHDGETWVADVHCDQLIYPEDPCPIVPERSSLKGRSAKRRIARIAPARVDRWVAAQPDTDWEKVALHNTFQTIKPEGVRLPQAWDRPARKKGVLSRRKGLLMTDELEQPKDKDLSALDEMFSASRRYCSSREYMVPLRFIGKLRRYAPYNRERLCNRVLGLFHVYFWPWWSRANCLRQYSSLEWKPEMMLAFFLCTYGSKTVICVRSAYVTRQTKKGLTHLLS